MRDNRNLMMGMALMIGAYFLFQRQAVSQYQRVDSRRRVPLGTGSMPGSAGSGAGQVIGGILGNMFAKMAGGGTDTGAPPTTATPPYIQDAVSQNNVALGDPNGSFNPEFVDYEFLGE